MFGAIDEVDYIVANGNEDVGAGDLGDGFLALIEVEVDGTVATVDGAEGC